MRSLSTRPKRSMMKLFLEDEEAATAAEYGILAALIAVAIIAAVKLFGTTLSGLFTKLTTSISGK